MSEPLVTQNLAISLGSPEEELERAELYGLLAQLWLAPPDAAMFEQFKVAVTQAPHEGSHLEAPWQDLVAAVRASSVLAAAE